MKSWLQDNDIEMYSKHIEYQIVKTFLQKVIFQIGLRNLL